MQPALSSPKQLILEIFHWFISKVWFTTHRFSDPSMTDISHVFWLFSFVKIVVIHKHNKLNFRLPICPFQIRVGNAVKTQVIRTVFSIRIPNSQSPLLPILRDFKNAPFYIHCHFHIIDLRMFSLIFCILLQNGPWFAMISFCSCCSFWHNIDVSVFQQLSSYTFEFDLIWKQTLLDGSQMS